MYTSYFGLEEAPFSILPDPRFLYMSERHREAFAHLLYGIRHDGGFVLLTGEVGTGKTTVCRCLLEQVPENVDLAFIVNPRLTVLELLATACDEFGIAYDPGPASVKAMVDRINDFLLEKNSQGRHAVLVIDEAQNLDIEVLEQIRLLTNLETNTRKLLQIIMIGQPELTAKLNQPELRQLSQRITARYHLAPLTREELVEYIRHRLSIAGMTGKVFSEVCIERLYQLSGGIPRIINLICDRAMLGAYSRNVVHVDIEILNQAAKEVLGGDETPRHGQTRAKMLKNPLAIAGLAGIAVLILLLSVVLLTDNDGGRSWLDDGAKEKTLSQQTQEVPGSVESPSVPPRFETRPDSESEQQPMMPDSATLLASLPIEGIPSQVANPDTLDWPVGENVAASRVMAFATVLESWQANSSGMAGNPCRYVESIGLRCLVKQGSVDDLYRVNRPAVLELSAPGKGVFYAALQVMDRNRATLRIAGSDRTVEIRDVVARWSGSYTVLWRPPPGFVDSIFPGDASPVVSWVAARLGGDMPETAGRGVIYDRDLVRIVKKFQYERGLVPDGVIGVQTLIQLVDGASGQVPVLHPEEEAR